MLGRSGRHFARFCAGLVAATVVSAGAEGADILIGADEDRPAAIQAARTLCRALDQSKDPRLPAGACAVTTTAGPLASLEGVSGGALDIALVPSDWLHHALNRSGPLSFVDIPFDGLRTLFLLNVEPLTIVARRAAGIAGLDDLVGQRIDIGAPGTRARVLMDAVVAAAGLSRGDFPLVEELPEAERSLALCHARIDATVFHGGHPDPRITDVVSRCDAVPVPVAGLAVTRLLAERPYLHPTAIPAGTYPGQDRPVAGFGPRMVAVVSQDLDNDWAAAVTATVIGALDMLKTAHPVFRGLDPAGMSRNGLTAPLHEGARQVFLEEAGSR
ncbi:MAG: TAXI family TRAP transporter solute-binding subunit [Rhodospirillales bacterium]|nr:MAG: TAXI family TRAP transporter solute-binding subunit [Rhodospirillales bacterium]TVR96931.1 MAG: TAXI family TRAP transporter solute-binding subunit [Rhodospirillales bacterium]